MALQCVLDLPQLNAEPAQFDLMVETTVDEAKMLIALVQLLVQEWYVDRQKRQSRCNTIKLMVDEARRSQESELVNHCASDSDSNNLLTPKNISSPAGRKPIDATLKDALEKLPPTGE